MRYSYNVLCFLAVNIYEPIHEVSVPFELLRDKSNDLWALRPLMYQISLGNCPVCSESSLAARRKFIGP